MAEPRQYRVYLLRIWQTQDQQGAMVWRAALEDTRTNERLGFADLSQLCAFLEAQTTPIAPINDELPQAES